MINVFASRQFGCFNIKQTREAGFDRNAVLRRIANGSGIQVLRFTYDMLRNNPDGCIRTIIDVGMHR